MTPNRRIAATMRQMEATAERIRSHRQHAQVNQVYREALRHLSEVICIALEQGTERGDADTPTGAEIRQLEQLYAMPAAKGGGR